MHCTSGFTFFRRDTQVRSTADQLDSSREWVYIVYDATKPGTEQPTGIDLPTRPSQGWAARPATFFLRYNGANGSHTNPVVIDNQSAGHQVFPDISADGGVLHAIWWDSRFDPCYSVTRPIGNCANRTTVPSLDVFAAGPTNHGATWAPADALTDVTSNPNWEQFDNRAVPFAGDYLWVTSLGDFAYSVWTDYRNTVQGADPRETTEDEDNATADVVQCRRRRRSKTRRATRARSGAATPARTRAARPGHLRGHVTVGPDFRRIERRGAGRRPFVFPRSGEQAQRLRRYLLRTTSP